MSGLSGTDTTKMHTLTITQTFSVYLELKVFISSFLGVCLPLQTSKFKFFDHNQRWCFLWPSTSRIFVSITWQTYNDMMFYFCCLWFPLYLLSIIIQWEYLEGLYDIMLYTQLCLRNTAYPTSPINGLETILTKIIIWHVRQHLQIYPCDMLCCSMYVVHYVLH